MKIKETLLNDCLDSIIGKKHIHSAVMRVESGDGSFVWSGARGDMQIDSPFFIASATKMVVTAVVLQLIEEKKLVLEDGIEKYLPDIDLEGLHVYKGKDYSKEITVKHLLSNTSGLPDYFFGKEGGKRVADLLMGGSDEAWGLARSLNHIRKIKPKFAPGNGVLYSDINFQLLGRIIENITGGSIGSVFARRVFEPIGLQNTYLYKDVTDTKPVPFYHGARRLWLPTYMASAGPDGGVVSTAEDLTKFAKAFYGGQFFPKERIDGLKQWRLLSPPPGLFYFGVGLERQPTPRFMSPFKPLGEIIGFWGQTSAFTWYSAKADLYFSGTANQTNVSGHTANMNAIIKIIKNA